MYGPEAKEASDDIGWFFNAEFLGSRLNGVKFVKSVETSSLAKSFNEFLRI
jgi:hypothetical protein